MCEVTCSPESILTLLRGRWKDAEKNLSGSVLQQSTMPRTAFASHSTSMPRRLAYTRPACADSSCRSPCVRLSYAALRPKFVRLSRERRRRPSQHPHVAPTAELYPVWRCGFQHLGTLPLHAARGTSGEKLMDLSNDEFEMLRPAFLSEQVTTADWSPPRPPGS